MSQQPWCPINRFVNIVGDKWSLLILRELSIENLRFIELKERIQGISMDQLTRKLQHLCDEHIIVKQMFSESPPRVIYQLTETGKAFVPVLKRIFYWSFENLWSEPAKDESLDIELNLRTMCSYWGQGAGLIQLSLFKQSGKENLFIERKDAGEVRIVHSLENPSVDCHVTLNLREMTSILSGKDKEVVSGYYKGSKEILERILPIFRDVKFVGQTPITHNLRNMNQAKAPSANL